MHMKNAFYNLPIRLSPSWSGSNVIVCVMLDWIACLSNYFVLLFMQKAIASAHTLEEVERLNKMLQSGQIPGAAELQQNGVKQDGMWMAILTGWEICHGILLAQWATKSTQPGPPCKICQGSSAQDNAVFQSLVARNIRIRFILFWKMTQLASSVVLWTPNIHNGIAPPHFGGPSRLCEKYWQFFTLKSVSIKIAPSSHSLLIYRIAVNGSSFM